MDTNLQFPSKQSSSQMHCIYCNQPVRRIHNALSGIIGLIVFIVLLKIGYCSGDGYCLISLIVGMVILLLYSLKRGRIYYCKHCKKKFTINDDQE